MPTSTTNNGEQLPVSDYNQTEMRRKKGRTQARKGRKWQVYKRNDNRRALLRIHDYVNACICILLIQVYMHVCIFICACIYKYMSKH